MYGTMAIILVFDIKPFSVSLISQISVEINQISDHPR